MRATLVHAGMSQNALARLIPVTSGYMSDLMRGSKSPSLYIQRRLQFIMGGCRYEDLFVNEEKKAIVQKPKPCLKQSVANGGA